MSYRLGERFGTRNRTDQDGWDGWDGSPLCAKKEGTPKTPIADRACIGVKGVLGVAAPKRPGSNPSHPSHPTTPNVSGPEPTPVQVTYPQPFNLVWSGKDHLVHFWAGEVLTGPEIAIDTETEVILGQEIPRLAMLTVSAGDDHFIVHPKDAAQFIETHASAHWVFFNVAFDFWVLHRHLSDQGRADLVAHLWEKAARNELHDVMLLDTLLGLARNGAADRRNLAEVAADFAPGIPLNKDDPYRLRYGELLDSDWATAESGFFTYAIKDAIATSLVDRALRPMAQQLAQAWSAWFWPGADERFGPLSETVQVKGAIALAAVGRTGLRQDRAALTRLDRELSERMRRLELTLLENSPCPDLVKRNKKGEIVRTKTGLPSIKQPVLQDSFQAILQYPSAAGLPPVPRKADGYLSETEDHWAPYASRFPFVAAWLELQRCGKMRQYAVLPAGERVHPRYNVLKLTGRTSAESPNLQQVPRNGGFRECYVPSLGHFFLIIDYAYIELVTLASICEQRFGHSRLADVIRSGVDPHCFTAALITGMPHEAFMELERTDHTRFKDLRQKAKALNFGIPGGMGGRSLLEYARANYGVILTIEQATEWRDKVITEIYPELSLYLADRTFAALAANLGTTEAALWSALQEDGSRPAWMTVCVRKILSGINTKKDGSPYNPGFLDRVWSGLVRACLRADLLSALMARQTGPGLAALCNESAVTPTGRIRSGVGYTEAHNTPFQGLASDGAKLACFELVRAGYRVVGFIHDEFIVELPVNADHLQEARRIESIVCGAMAEVVNRIVPVRSEYALATCWSKAVKPIHKDGRLLPWSPN